MPDKISQNLSLMDNNDVIPRGIPERALYERAHLETRSEWKEIQNREEVEGEKEDQRERRPTGKSKGYRRR